MVTEINIKKVQKQDLKNITKFKKIAVECFHIGSFSSLAHSRQCVYCGCLQSSPWQQLGLSQTKADVGPRGVLRPPAPPNPSLPHVGLWLSGRTPGERLYQRQNEDAEQRDAQCRGIGARMWGRGEYVMVWGECECICGEGGNMRRCGGV